MRASPSLSVCLLIGLAHALPLSRVMSRMDQMTEMTRERGSEGGRERGREREGEREGGREGGTEGERDREEARAGGVCVSAPGKASRQRKHFCMCERALRRV